MRVLKIGFIHLPNSENKSAVIRTRQLWSILSTRHYRSVGTAKGHGKVLSAGGVSQQTGWFGTPPTLAHPPS